MDSLSTAAVTNHHKFSGLKQHTFVVLQFWKQVRNLKMGLRDKNEDAARLHSYGKLWRILYFLSFLASGACLHSLARGPLPAKGQL